MLTHAGTHLKTTQKWQSLETLSLQPTPIILSFRATFRSHYCTQGLKTLRTINPRRKLALYCNDFGYHLKGNEVEDIIKLQDFLLKCKINLDLNLRNIANFMTRNCMHIQPATMTCCTRTQSHNLLTINQKHFVGMDEMLLQEERLNYLMEQAKSPCMNNSSGLIS